MFSNEDFLKEALGLELETPLLPMSYLFEMLSTLSHELGMMAYAPYLFYAISHLT